MLEMSSNQYHLQQHMLLEVLLVGSIGTVQDSTGNYVYSWSKIQLRYLYLLLAHHNLITLQQVAVTLHY